MIKKLLLIIAFLASLMADQSVSVTTSINRGDYADKDLQKLQHILLDKAKLEAASQLFGDFIKSETSVKDGNLLRDLILAERGGIVHIQGNPQYGNGKNLGELQVSITAYATQQDIEDMKVHRIDLKDFIYSDKTLTLAQLKSQADNAFLIEAIGQKRPSIKTAPNAAELAKKLALSVNITQKDFNPDWLAYKMSGYVEYIPIFLRNDSGEDAKKVIAKFGLKKNTAVLNIFGYEDNYIGTITHNGKGFLIGKDIVKLLEQNTKAGRQTIAISAKLLVPESVKSDTVTVHLLGPLQPQNYGVSINGENLEKNKIDANVIHNGNERFINLTIHGTTQYIHIIKQNILNDLSRMSFAISEEGSVKKISSSVCIAQPLQRSSEAIFGANLSVFGYNENLYTGISNLGNGFVFESKIQKLLEQNTKAGRQTIAISAKLLVPESVKSDTVTVHLLGPLQPQDYGVSINGENLEKNKIDANVIHNGNERFINLTIHGTTQYIHIIKQNILNDLSRMSFAVEDEHKLYLLVPCAGEQAQKLFISNQASSGSYKLPAISNDVGIFLAPQSLKQIDKNVKEGRQTIAISAKLLVPESVKSDTVTVHLLGPLQPQNYGVSINGENLEKNKIDANVIHNGNERFINLTIHGTTQYIHIIKQNILNDLSRMSFAVEDSQGVWHHATVTQ